MNLLRNTAKFAMSITAGYINTGDTVVDATVGNGNDTLALSRLVGLWARQAGCTALTYSLLHL